MIRILFFVALAVVTVWDLIGFRKDGAKTREVVSYIIIVVLAITVGALATFTDIRILQLFNFQ